MKGRDIRGLDRFLTIVAKIAAGASAGADREENLLQNKTRLQMANLFSGTLGRVLKRPFRVRSRCQIRT